MYEKPTNNSIQMISSKYVSLDGTIGHISNLKATNLINSHSHTRSFGRILPVNTLQNSNIKPTKPQQFFHKQLLENPKLSTSEKSTLNQINEIYYMNTSKFLKYEPRTDNKGYYHFFIDDHILFRYQILEEIGQGTFGTVLKCKDHKTNEIVAIKILRNKPEFLESGENEIKTLNILSNNDQETCIVNIKNSFKFKGHLCLVFELLSINLYEFLKSNYFKGLHFNFVKRLTLQILIALKYSHGLGIVHCDLKPENIMLKVENKSSAKVIDFGSAHCAGGEKFDYIQSRFYRAPEIILQIDWNEKIDIWSLGCIIVELITGWPLFSGNDEIEVFLQMVNTLGKPPQYIFNKGRLSSVFSYDVIRPQLITPNFKDCSLDCILQGAGKNLVDFIKKILTWDANERLSAEDALLHPWMKSCHY